ncbi:MAG: hypothetical protein ACE5E5_15960 [Phycisphaerae bacterium]
MADVLIYWRDYAENRGTLSGKASGLQDDGGVLVWHSSAKCIADLQPGDRMWMVTSGKGLGDRRAACSTELGGQAAFLVGVWAVREVTDNPNDDPAYPAEDYRKRVVADPSGSVMLTDPVPVDHILRPAGRDRAVSIGRFLQGPRVLSDEKKRLLRAAAGGELAAEWLRSKV